MPNDHGRGSVLSKFSNPPAVFRVCWFYIPVCFRAVSLMERPRGCIQFNRGYAGIFPGCGLSQQQQWDVEQRWLERQLLVRRSDWDGLPPSKSLFCSPKGTGLPIGDLTSQLFSNIYLNELDQFVKRELHQRHYGRYVDDFYVVSEHRNELKRLVPIVRAWLKRNLRLQLHPNKVVLQPVGRSLLFLGACLRPYRRYLRRRTVGKFRLRMYQLSCILMRHPDLSAEGVFLMRSIRNSYLGYLGHHFHTYKMVKRHVDVKPFYTRFYYMDHFRRACFKKAA